MSTSTISHGSSWPHLLVDSFANVASTTQSGKTIYGPWNRLLNTLFPPDTQFEVVPHYSISNDATDVMIFLLIYIETSPIFLVELKQPSDFRYSSKRQEADIKMRQCFLDCVDEMQIPVLHGVSVFGTKMAFYRLNKTSHVLEPRKIVPDRDRLTDIAPKDWWCWDILEEEGADKFRAVVEDVKAMCSGVIF
ncbi:hypothetical protein QCA50_003744 [Cerrena zonata]|uniref:Uncharacterized protein n=1 Tax=Cerrena zonata TaxID=2478898 RepID=A0AAW0GSA4_9APHY